MQYLHHNFMSNFTASVEAGESDMTKGIFVNELSDFIVYDTARLLEAMKKAGLDVRENDSDEELIDIVIKSLGNNQKLATTLAFIIAEANQLINNGKTDKSKTEEVVKEIASGLLIVGKDIRTGDSSKQFKEDVLEHVYAKAEAKGDYRRDILKSDKPFGKRAGYVVLGTIGVIGLIIFFAYRVQKKKQVGALVATALAPIPQTFETGGNMPPVTPVAEIVPAVTTPAPVIAPVAPTPIVSPVSPTTTAPATNG
jgi:hypothetical protein